MKLKRICTCDICGVSQQVNKENLSCVKCGAPLKPEEFLAAVQAVVKKDFSIFPSSLNEQWCVHIIDASKWQGNINPSVYGSSDAKYLIIKASQANWADSKFEDNVQMCIDNVLPFGLYHYLDVRKPVDESAKFFSDQVNALNLANNDDGFSKDAGFCKVRFWLDVESTFGETPEEMRNHILDFLRIFEVRTGLKFGIYTRGYFWNDFVAPMDGVHKLPLWVAHYNSWITEPFIPDDWSRFGETWELWQYSADGNGEGSEYGAESYSIDKNRFIGGCDEFHRRFIGGEVVTPPPPQECDCLQLEVINTNALRVRTEPSTSGGGSTTLYTMQRGTVVDVLNIIPKQNETWIEIKPGEFSAMFYNGYYYLKKVSM